MDKKELIEKYNEGNLSNDEQELLEKWIEDGIINLQQLEDVQLISQEIPTTEIEVDYTLDAKFYALLETEKLKLTSELKNKTLVEWWNSLWQYNYQWGYGLMLLVIGLGLGYWVLPNRSTSNHVNQLTSEVQQLKELMMLTMIEQNSSTDRLKAVSLTTKMDTVSEKVAVALINVLQNDENTNVRLAAVDVLALYTSEPKIREALINSIAHQESPLVQLALAELMVAINEKKAIDPLNNIIENENTPDEVKKELQSALQAII